MSLLGFLSFFVFVFVFVLFCFVLFCFVLFCFVLFCFVLFCFVLFCSVLFCFVLFCFVCFLFFIFLKMKLNSHFLSVMRDRLSKCGQISYSVSCTCCETLTVVPMCPTAGSLNHQVIEIQFLVLSFYYVLLQILIQYLTQNKQTHNLRSNRKVLFSFNYYVYGVDNL